MKDALLRLIPGLTDAVARSDHRRVLALLREHVYETVVWSNDGLLLQHYCGGDLRKLSAEEIARLFENREIGVLCGDTSTFLAKVHALFGYEASRYYYGLPEASEHVVTIVGTPTARGLVPVVQDATFNSTFILKDSPNPSFIEVMDLILAGRSNEIVLKKGRVEPRTIGFSDTPEGREHLRVYRETGILLEEPRQVVSSLTNTPIFLARGDLDFESSYLRRNGARVRAGLSRALGKPKKECHILELMLFAVRMPVFDDGHLQRQIGELGQRIHDFHERVSRNDRVDSHAADQGVPV